jgi:predicted dehydrogenase
MPTLTSPLFAVVIGAGIAGARHAAAQKALGSKVGVYDLNSATAKKLAEKHKYLLFSTLEEAIAWADVVHVCTPDNAHLEAIQVAVELGKAVLCEKPLTDSWSEAQKLLEIVKKNNGVCVVGNNYRLTNAFQYLKKQIAKDRSPIISMEATYLHNMRQYLKETPWRAEQNFLYGGAIHAIDLLCWMAQEPVIAVQGFASKISVIDSPFPQDYRITLQFKSGYSAHVWANAGAVLPIHKTDLNVYTENTTYISDNKSEYLKIYSKNNPYKEFVLKNISVNMTVDEEVKIMNDWLTGKRKDHAPLPEIEEAVSILKILDAIERSIAEKKVVRLKK